MAEFSGETTPGEYPAANWACIIGLVQREGLLADYYPLILRAVQGLDRYAPRESRRALYERARAALILQLQGVQPPLSENETKRERLALEEAIRKVEDENGLNDTEDSFGANSFRLQEPEPELPHSDPLAELARLIGQAGPLGTSPHTTPAPAGLSEVDLSPVHPLHRYPAQQPLDPFTSDGPIIPAGPPQWLEEVRKRARNVVDEIYLPTVSSGPTTPPIEIIPEQDLANAIAFRPSRRGPLELLPDPPKDPHDPEQSQLYARVRQQLQKMQADIPSQEREQIDDAVNDFLAQPSSWQNVEFKKVLWLCGNALRNTLAQHDAIKDNPEPHYSKLPPSVAEAMRRPVEAWNVFVLGDDDMVDLDTKRLGPQEQQSVANDIKTARPIVESAAADRNITTEQTARVLDAGLHAAATTADNINARQAKQVVAGTLKNLITQLVRRAYLTCLAIAEPKTDDDRALIAEYKKGIARGVGTAAVGTAMAATTIAVPYAVTFFEFVIQHAAAIKEYFAIASHSPQLVQVIEAIEYVRLKLTSEKQ